MTKIKLVVPAVGFRYRSIGISEAADRLAKNIELERDLNNSHDQNAVAVLSYGVQVAYIAAKTSERVSNLLEESDENYTAKIQSVHDKYINLEIEFNIEEDKTQTETKYPNTPGIYSINISSNGRNFIYIGQSLNISNRINRHLLELGKKNHANLELQRAYNSRISIDFSVLQLVYGEDELDTSIQLWRSEVKNIVKARKNNAVKCVNILDGELILNESSKNLIKRSPLNLRKTIKCRINEINKKKSELISEIKTEAKNLKLSDWVVNNYFRNNKKSMDYRRARQTLLEFLNGEKKGSIDQYEKLLGDYRGLKSDLDLANRSEFLITFRECLDINSDGRSIKEEEVKELYLKNGLMEEWSVIQCISDLVFSDENRNRCFPGLFKKRRYK